MTQVQDDIDAKFEFRISNEDPYIEYEKEKKSFGSVQNSQQQAVTVSIANSDLNQIVGPSILQVQQLDQDNDSLEPENHIYTLPYNQVPSFILTKVALI